MKYPRHPISAVFPIVSDDEAAEHIESIRETGLIDDIVIHDGQVLDGWNRQLWCEAAGAEPRYREFGSRPSDGTCPATFAMALNLGRRHMAINERQAAAARMIPFFQQETGLSRGKVVEQLAEKFDVSPRTVAAASFVRENAPDEFEKLEKGEVTAAAAEKTVRNRRSTEQAAAASNPALDSARKTAAETARQHHGDAWADDLAGGKAIKTATDLEEYVNMSVTEQGRIIPLLRKGWKIEKARAFLARDVDCNDRVELLIIRAQCIGKKLVAIVDGYEVTIRRLKDAPPEPA